MQIELPKEWQVSDEQVRVDLSVGLYTSRTISLARAAKLSGLSRVDFQRILAERRIPVSYDTQDLQQDVETLKRLRSL